VSVSTDGSMPQAEPGPAALARRAPSRRQANTADLPRVAVGRHMPAGAPVNLDGQAGQGPDLVPRALLAVDLRVLALF
jgi:hypothetical protein